MRVREKTLFNIRIYIITALFGAIFIILSQFPSYAGITSGKKYILRIANAGNGEKNAIHNSGEGDEKMDVWYGNIYWLIESYNGGYSIRATTGKNSNRLPYMSNGGSWSNLSYSPTAYYFDASGDYYYIRNTQGKYLQTYVDSRYGDTLVSWITSKNNATLINMVPEGYTISFNVNGGSTSISTQTISSISLPNPGSKTGYTFDGWYNGGTRVGGVGTSWTPTANTTLTAKWTPVTYSISYVLNGGSNNSGNPSSYNIETATITLKDPTRTGYTFAGWHSDSGLTSRVTTINKGSTGNKTFYAKWTPRTDTRYVVNHQLQNVDGNGYTLKDTENLTGTTDTSVTPARKSYTGFTAPAAQTATINANGSRVFTYSYSRNKYTATFNGNGGTASKTSASLYYEATLGTLPTATRVGYDFKGWFTAASGGTQITSSTKLMGNTTYYAQWTPRTDTKYVVKHQLQNVDGNGYTLQDTDNFQGTSDTSVTPDTKTYTGFTAPAKQTVNINADGSRVVTYSYSRNKYKFTMGTDTGVSTEGSTATGSYYYGATITLKATPSNGYKWDKWSNGDANQASSVTMPAGDLTVAPEVHPITYTITYKLNGGKVDYKKTSYNVETPTFYIENPTKKGYNFTGWTGTGISDVTTDLSVAIGSYGDKTFEATWGKDVYTIGFDGNGETSGSMEVVTVESGKSVILPKNGFIRDGYSFVGWYTTKEDRFGTFYKNGAEITDLTESITLHAQWRLDRGTHVHDGSNDPEGNGDNGNGGNAGSGTGNGASTGGNGSGNSEGGPTGGNTGDNGNDSGNGDGTSAGGNTSGTGGNGSGSAGDNGNGSGNNGDGTSTGDNGNGSGSGNSGSGHGNGQNASVVTPIDEIGYFGTGKKRNEISLLTSHGINDKTLTLNYNY